jgi:hypothetical protein
VTRLERASADHHGLQMTIVIGLGMLVNPQIKVLRDFSNYFRTVAPSLPRFAISRPVLTQWAASDGESGRQGECNSIQLLP